MSLARHTAYNLTGWFAPILVSFVTVPLYLRVVGIERYGLLAICWTILGFMGFMSLGMGPAVAQRLARERNSPPEARSVIFWNAEVVSVLAGAVGGILLLVLGGFYFRKIAVTDPALTHEIARGLPWLCLTFILSLATGVTTGALQGRERFGVLNIASIVASVATAVAPLIAAVFFGPSLPVLLIATLIVYAASFLVQLVLCRSAVPLVGRPSVNAETTRNLLDYGGWMTLVSLLAPITMLSDRLVIGGRFGSAAVSIYVVPYNLVSRVLAIPASLSSASLPKLAGAGEADEQALLTLGLRLLLASLGPICVAGNAVMGPFLHFWVGDLVAQQGAMIGSVLVFGFWMHGIGHIPSTVLLGRGRPDMVAKLYIAYLIFYFPLLFLFMNLFGIVGAAVAWSLRSSLDLTLFWFARTGKRLALETALSTLLVLASSAAAIFLDWHHAVYWVALPLLLVIAMVMAIWIVPPTMLRSLRQLLKLRARPPETGEVVF